MRAEDLFQALAELLYVTIFVAVLVGALRRPSRTHLDMVLFFGDTALVVLFSTLLQLLALPNVVFVDNLEGALIMVLPYLLLRLVADFMGVPFWIMRVAELGLVLAIVALFGVPPPMPVPGVMLLVAYFVGLSLYASIAFFRGSLTSRGVTRRRLEAVALGSVFLGLDILVAGLGTAVPDRSNLWGILGPLFGMSSGLAYVLGFAPPTWLRRAWQEPELRAFLERSAAIPHLPNTEAIVAELQRGAAEATGVTAAAVGLIDDSGASLRFFGRPPSTATAPTLPGQFEPLADGWRLDASAPAVAARAFRERRPLLVRDISRDDPANAALYAEYATRAAIGAPIVAGGQPLGVLLVYAPRAPLFADSDVELVQLLADQAAVILESRKLLDAAAQVQARAEATRMKEDFLSSAAHDLKTPITGILAQAQVIQRRLERQAADPMVPAGVARIVGEARRLSALVLELLDVSLLEQGRLITTRESVDLVELAAAVCARHTRGPVTCRAEAPASVVADLDPIRVRQLLDHLVDNAVKFSPVAVQVVIQIWKEGNAVRMDVRDTGIGIPAQDVAQVFERFHRGSNVDDRRFVGLGLGLYLSRGIVEQHGGRIWVGDTSTSGTTFSISLPIVAAAALAAPMHISHAVAE